MGHPARQLMPLSHLPRAGLMQMGAGHPRPKLKAGAGEGNPPPLVIPRLTPLQPPHPLPLSGIRAHAPPTDGAVALVLLLHPP
jgi:hypothetical protein